MLRVKDALIQLAAELANTLPQHAPGLLADVRELCPALTVCRNGCACAWAAMTNDENPASDADACREPAGGGFDDDSSAGAACSSGSSSCAVQNGPVSSSTSEHLSVTVRWLSVLFHKWAVQNGPVSSSTSEHLSITVRHLCVFFHKWALFTTVRRLCVFSHKWTPVCHSQAVSPVSSSTYRSFKILTSTNTRPESIE